MSEESKIFTAIQFARALGRESFSIRRSLEPIPADGKTIVYGREVNAWCLESVPKDWQDQIAERARKRGFATACAYLAEPGKQWEPTIPKGEIHPESWEKARKLRMALEPFAAGPRPGESDADFERRGLADYRAVFSYEVMARTWHRQLDLVRDRDGGFEQWGRIEIYLPDRIKRSKPVGGAISEDFEGLRSFLSGFHAGDSSPFEMRELWQNILQTFESGLSLGRPEREFKRDLIKYLATHASFLDCSRRTFNRKLQEWRQHDRRPIALTDKRIEANQARRKKLSPDDKAKIVACALKDHGGDYTTAYRQLRETHQLSEQLCRHKTNPFHRDYVPRTIRREVKPELDRFKDCFFRPDYAKANGPYSLPRRDLCAGDSFTADDLTPELAVAVLGGKHEYTTMRGQLLLMIDEASRKILGHLYVAERGYTGPDIEALSKLVCRVYHVPRVRFRWERGIWQNSKLAGKKVPWGEGFANFADRLGICIDHAYSPTGKGIMENFNRVFQLTLRDFENWVGPDEMKKPNEKVKQARLDVESGRKTFWEAGIPLFEQMEQFLREKEESFNNTERRYEMPDGQEKVMTPNQAWIELQPKDSAGKVEPVTALTPELAYLLDHAERYPVGRNGIHFEISGQKFDYSCKELEGVEGEEVNTYWDWAAPETIAVEMPDKSILTVPAIPHPSLRSGTNEEWAAEFERKNGWHKRRKARLAATLSSFSPPRRQLWIDPEAQAQAVAVNAGRNEAKAAQKEQSQERQKVARLAAQTGLPEEGLSSDSLCWIEILNRARGGVNRVSNT